MTLWIAGYVVGIVVFYLLLRRCEIKEGGKWTRKIRMQAIGFAVFWVIVALPVLVHVLTFKVDWDKEVKW